MKRAIKSGDIPKDVKPLDLLRALIGVSYVPSSPDWQQSAKRLVDILIAGFRRSPVSRRRDEGVPTRDIAAVIGRRLNVPVVAKSREEAADHFGWISNFVSIDSPASSAQTRQQLGWLPIQPGLIPDLDAEHYFAMKQAA